MTDFEKLVSLIKKDRLRNSTNSTRSLLTETESDKARIINAAAFRRLQQKTQVFPLEPNAAVRSRLTHSIEVSQIGRFLCQEIIELSDASKLPYKDLAPFLNIVESSCLLHDIGNPPFGHLGEAAIRRWAKDKNLSQDLQKFDGNPQGFRVVSLLQGDDEFGLNLTCSLLLSSLKYPHNSAATTGNKFGFFKSSEQTYQKCLEKVRWGSEKRYPFSMLMEAADDIAYSFSDLEDGIEKGILREKDVLSYFEKLGKYSSFLEFKTKTITDSVKEAAEVFKGSLEQILEGEEIELLSSESNMGKVIGCVKDYTAKNVYSNPEAEHMELAGGAIVEGLLTEFYSILELDSEDFGKLVEGKRKHAYKNGLDFQLRLVNLLPRRHLKIYQDYVGKSHDEKEMRAHLIVDFVSGMSDGYALEMFQLLRGIRVS